MKKLLVVPTLMILHSSAFALVGFGFQGGTDMTKLGAFHILMASSLLTLLKWMQIQSILEDMLSLTYLDIHLKRK